MGEIIKIKADKEEEKHSKIKKTFFRRYFFVKLHSELALPTELQLDRVGVDFVFPRHD